MANTLSVPIIWISLIFLGLANAQNPNTPATANPNLSALPVQQPLPPQNPSVIPQVDPNASPYIDISGQRYTSVLDGLDAAIPSRISQSKAEVFDGGSSMSAYRPNSSIIRSDYSAKRIKVYADDPESAWWEVNVRHAFARAQREMRPLLLLFTAQWSPNAMYLSKEVFGTKSFNNYVKENLVICYLNFPKDLRNAPKSLKWAKEEFKVSGYPNVLIFSPKGEVHRGIRGYSIGRPVDYFNELKTACGPVLSDIAVLKESLERQGYRDWHSSNGRVLFAKFIRRDDRLMTLRDGRGQEWTVSIDQLVEEDQLMAQTYPRIDQVVPQESQK